MGKVVIISGASSGFGALSARALADAGNTVYAGIRETAGRNAGRVADAERYAGEHGVDLRAVELDVLSQDSVDAAVAAIIGERAAEYEELYGGISEAVGRRFAELTPVGTDAGQVADEISRIVALPAGTRPFRSHVDPVDQGSEEVSEVADRVREEALTRLGLEDLLRPAVRK